MSRIESAPEALDLGGILFEEASDINNSKWGKAMEAESFLKGLSGQQRQEILKMLNGKTPEERRRMIEELMAQEESK